ncbi:hypothetical protein J6590_000538 [Homalodisca vitripennis]|nr:hypothetical protein J6590_000538 [Homalodisca vitripennis]
MSVDRPPSRTFFTLSTISRVSHQASQCTLHCQPSHVSVIRRHIRQPSFAQTGPMSVDRPLPTIFLYCQLSHVSVIRRHIRQTTIAQTGPMSVDRPPSRVFFILPNISRVKSSGDTYVNLPLHRPVQCLLTDHYPEYSYIANYLMCQSSGVTYVNLPLHRPNILYIVNYLTCQSIGRHLRLLTIAQTGTMSVDRPPSRTFFTLSTILRVSHQAGTMPDERPPSRMYFTLSTISRVSYQASYTSTFLRTDRSNNILYIAKYLTCQVIRRHVRQPTIAQTGPTSADGPPEYP